MIIIYSPEQVNLSLQTVYLLSELLSVSLFRRRQLLAQVVHPRGEADRKTVSQDNMPLNLKHKTRWGTLSRSQSMSRPRRTGAR